jgi:predicted RNA-binding Zn-ribbon protein involved in translation (DUF1610 family)
MIIWSSTSCEKVISSGQFHCPNCDSQQLCKHMSVSKYFTLYFIPLFETAKLGEYVRCEGCGIQFSTEVLTYQPPTPKKGGRLVRRGKKRGKPS